MSVFVGYPSAVSVSPGEQISFHVNAFPYSSFWVGIYRKGRHENLAHSGTGTVDFHSTPADAYATGCNWPAAYTVTVDSSWSSGLYLARFVAFGIWFISDAMAEILFVVKAAAPGTNSKILYQLAVTTYQAYNQWGGKSLYEPGGAESNKVSFSRPFSAGSRSYFYHWDLPFIQWLENNGFEVEYCTSIDLHADPNFLNNY